MRGARDVRQTEIHTAEPLWPETSACEFQLAIGKLKSHKSQSIDQIPAELIKAEGRTIRYEIQKPIISIWNRLFNFNAEYAVWRVQVNQDFLK